MIFLPRIRTNTNAILLAAIFGVAGWIPIHAQSYQTAFAGEKFDQAKGPATYHSGVEVDAATGAASMNLPLGPGIGQRGVHYVPTLRCRIAPQLGVAVDGSSACTTASPGFVLSPGHFDLCIDPIVNYGFITNWEFPDGAASSASGVLPASVTTTTATNLINRFYPSSSNALGNFPYQTSGGTKTPLVQPGTNGEIVIGMISSSFPERVVSIPSYCYMPVNWSIPGQVLVVRGEVAYEYTFRNKLYVDPYADALKLQAGHYVLTAIRNGFGDVVTFTYASSALSGADNGVDFTATWTALGGNPGTSVSVTLASVTGAGAPVLNLYPWWVNPATSYNNLANLKVAYSGVSNVSTYSLSGATTQTTMPSTAACYYANGVECGIQNGFEDFRESFQATNLQVDATGEAITFGYGLATGVNVPWNGTYFTPNTLVSVSFPGRNIILDWSYYQYMPNAMSPNMQGLRPGKLSWACGVSRVHDQDVSSSGLVERLTIHQRVVPIPTSWGGNCPTTFTDTITRPDGTIQLLKFAEPSTLAALNAAVGVGVATDPEVVQIQTLAFLKAMVREERDYRNSSDLGNDAPYKVVVTDRWDLRKVTNGTGSVGAGAVPYSTRTKTWDADTQVWTIQENQSWDNTHMGWQTAMSYVYCPTASPDMSFEWLSLARTNASPSYAAPCFDRSTTRTFGSVPNQWYWGRVLTEQRVGLPLTTKGYDDTTNLVSTSTIGGSSLSVTTNYTYTGPLLTGVMLSSPQNLVGSGTTGAMYGYDSLGYMNKIQPNAPAPAPVAISWFMQQLPDALGRPLNQTDANGKVSQYQYDNAGRLQLISPPDGEQPTSIVVEDNDHLGVTVTRGVQKTEYRYDGFNQLVLIRRWDGSNNISHKTFTYDSMGRKTVESIWLPLAGSDAEGRTNTVGDKTIYDSRGRVTDHIDPNGLTVHTTYNGIVQTLSGAVNSIRTYDALGRLIEVDDALGQATVYQYNLADQILNTIQYAGAKYSGTSQTRSWTYDPSIGWLTSVTQPESGTTAYSNWTVTGKPLTTNYNGRVVTSSVDTLMRPTRVWSTTDGSVDQEFWYDGDPSTYGAVLGRLFYARDMGTERISSYFGMGGRISGLNTNTWTGGALNSGMPLSCNQAFNYDNYGNRSSSTAGQSAVTSTMDYARGMIQGVSVNGTSLATAIFDQISWNVVALNYANHANTTFAYDTDQHRLHAMIHTVGGQSLANWIYNYDTTTGYLLTDNEDSYQYDPLGRLLLASVQRLNNQGTISQSFTYDAFGNQTSSVATGNLPSSSAPGYNINNFQFNASEQAQMAVKNQLPPTSGGAQTGALYDPQGNLTQFWTVGNTQTELMFIYDSLGRVVQMGDSNRQVTETYAYSTDGLRILVQIFQSGVLQKAEFNVYNDQRQLVSQYELVLE